MSVYYNSINSSWENNIQELCKKEKFIIVDGKTLLFFKKDGEALKLSMLDASQLLYEGEKLNPLDVN
jgi:predicted ribosome-associated RNA-binding protein Tma20